ncbi:MAG: nicotinate-nucleotide--dimethylbenzimidazole phosphoribosyltransferase [Saccharofermentanales bacterium]|jgi:nicotinate-nucleotide--dimethylbenzimidazole phosphoribosyltransferase
MQTYTRETFFNDMTTLPKPNRARERATQFRWRSLCKPIDSFGLLETTHIRLSGWSPDDELRLQPRAVFVFAADNGIVEEGVTQTGQGVTAQVMRNMAQGRATINTLAAEAHCVVVPVNVGVAELDTHVSGIVHVPVMPEGTHNFAKEDAMDEDSMMLAIRVGMELAAKSASEGMRLLIAGEMGIGNTSTAATVIAALSGRQPSEIAGRGAGLSDEAFQRKLLVLDDALSDRRPNRYNALDVLRAVGGLDIAAMVGFYAGAARAGVPVILDGLITLSAAMTLVRLVPETRAIFFASHHPAEPAGDIALREIGLLPMIDAGFRHGEGTGAMFLLPLLDMADRLYRDTLTFDEGDVAPYDVYGD